jgi:pimeloyl-ACP methyl ester carboxylesterase
VRTGLERFGRVSAPQLPRDPAAALAVASATVEREDVVIGHSMGGVLTLQLSRGRAPRALILTSCFFPPARNAAASARRSRTTVATASRSCAPPAADRPAARPDFTLAAAARQGWAVAVLAHGGHQPHVDTPERWLAAAVPWLERLGGLRGEQVEPQLVGEEARGELTANAVPGHIEPRRERPQPALPG